MTIDQPRFSVVICTHNRARLLPRAMESVLDQVSADYELLVVDDGSTDETATIVQALAESHVRYVYRANGGLSAARNTGAEHAKGDFLVFLDDDDRFLPGLLERVASALAEDEYGVASWGTEVIDESGGHLYAELPVDLGAAFADYRGLFKAGTFAVARNLYHAVGGFDEELRASHQFEFALRLLPRCRSEGIGVVAIEDHLIEIVFRDVEVRERNDPERLLTATRRIVDHHEDRLQRSPRLLAGLIATAGVAAARIGNYAEARNLLARAARTAPDHGLRIRNWARFAVAAIPPLSRRVWPLPQGRVSETEADLAT